MLGVVRGCLLGIEIDGHPKSMHNVCISSKVGGYKEHSRMRVFRRIDYQVATPGSAAKAKSSSVCTDQQSFDPALLPAGHSATSQ